jgi:hypothetical protein
VVIGATSVTFIGMIEIGSPIAGGVALRAGGTHSGMTGRGAVAGRAGCGETRILAGRMATVAG